MTSGTILCGRSQSFCSGSIERSYGPRGSNATLRVRHKWSRYTNASMSSVIGGSHIRTLILV